MKVKAEGEEEEGVAVGDWASGSMWLQGRGQRWRIPAGSGAQASRGPTQPGSRGLALESQGTLLRHGRPGKCAPSGGERWRAATARVSESGTCPSRPSDVSSMTSSRWLDFGLGGAFTPWAPADATNQGLLLWFGPRFPQHPLPADRKGSQGDRRERMAGNDTLAGVCEPAPEAFMPRMVMV